MSQNITAELKKQHGRDLHRRHIYPQLKNQALKKEEKEMLSFIPKDILSPFIGEEYVARARRERRSELASSDDIQSKRQNTKNKNKNQADDLAFILGLSWRFRSSTSDVDLVEGFDARRLLALRRGFELLGDFLLGVKGVLGSWLVGAI